MKKKWMFCGLALIMAVSLLTSSNAGATRWQDNWEQITVPGVGDSVCFRTIEFLDQDHGVAVGYNLWSYPLKQPTVVFYENGKWVMDTDVPQRIYGLGGTFKPYTVSYIDLNHIVVADKTGGIVHKINGQWLDRDVFYLGQIAPGYHGGDAFTMKQFTSPDHLIVGSDYSRLFESFDAGQTWAVLDSTRNPMDGIKGWLTKICVVDSLHAWVCGSRWIIMATKDGGQTWQIQRIDLDAKGLWTELRSISFCDTLNGWAVGDRQRAYKTEDGGKNWIEVIIPDPYSEDMILVKVISPQEIWLGTYDGLIHSTDGGQTWRLSYINTNGIFAPWDCHFLNPNEAWFVGAYNLFLHYTRTPIPNSPPVFQPIPDQQVKEGGKLKFVLQASDADEDTLCFSCQNLPDGACLTDSLFIWTPGFDQAGTYSVLFKVSDGELEDSLKVEIEVLNTNRAPQITHFSPQEDTIYAESGYEVSFHCQAKDEDGDTLFYQWTVDYPVFILSGIDRTHFLYQPTEDVSRVECLVSDSQDTVSQTWTVILRVGVEEEEVVSLPQELTLKNYPNPFNSSTTIQYILPYEGKVNLIIFNLQGQIMRTLVEEKKGPGIYTVLWDGRDNQGKEVSTGVYFYQLKTPEKALSKKMLLLK